MPPNKSTVMPWQTREMELMWVEDRINAFETWLQVSTILAGFSISNIVAVEEDKWTYRMCYSCHVFMLSLTTALSFYSTMVLAFFMYFVRRKLSSDRRRALYIDDWKKWEGECMSKHEDIVNYNLARKRPKSQWLGAWTKAGQYMVVHQDKGFLIGRAVNAFIVSFYCYVIAIVAWIADRVPLYDAVMSCGALILIAMVATVHALFSMGYSMNEGMSAGYRNSVQQRKTTLKSKTFPRESDKGPEMKHSKSDTLDAAVKTSLLRRAAAEHLEDPSKQKLLGGEESVYQASSP